MSGAGGAPGRVVCLGEMLLRLSAPGRGALLHVPSLDAHFGGAETNVAVALARLGRPSALVTCLPDDMIGDAALQAVLRYGIDCAGVVRQPGRLGLYYLAPGAGLRAAAIVYDRAGSVFARARPGDFDWPALLGGAEWLHLSGITPALGPGSAELALAAARAARRLGVRVSFDGNYRARLWEAWDAEPAAILRELVAEADLLFGNGRDVALLLGPANDGRADPRAAALRAFDHFPSLRWIAATERTATSAEQHRLSARIDTRDAAVETEPVELGGIVDRIGSGDAFAAGVLAAEERGPEQAVATGLALGALKHYTTGDFSVVGPAELADFLAGHRDVRR